MTASGGGGWVEGLSKKGKGLIDKDNSVMTAREGGIRRLTGNGKQYKKIKF